MFVKTAGPLVNVPRSAIKSVWPSGVDFATKSAPILPFAPTLFSIINACPNCSWSRAAKGLATASVAPPGANGMIIRTGLLGHVWEKEGVQIAPARRPRKV